LAMIRIVLGVFEVLKRLNGHLGRKVNQMGRMGRWFWWGKRGSLLTQELG
jgi:hypothetical protein